MKKKTIFYILVSISLLLSLLAIFDIFYDRTLTSALGIIIVIFFLYYWWKDDYKYVRLYLLLKIIIVWLSGR